MAADPREPVPIRGISATDFALVAYQKIPKLEAEVDEAKSAAMAACGMAREARDMAREARDGVALLLKASGTAAMNGAGPKRYDSPPGGFKMPPGLKVSDTGSHLIPVDIEKALANHDAFEDAKTLRSLKTGAGKIAIIVLGGLCLVAVTAAITLVVKEAFGRNRAPHTTELSP